MVKAQHFHCKGAQIGTLGVELRSHKLCRMAGEKTDVSC